MTGVPSEHDRIGRIRAQLEGIGGEEIGDDAAVLDRFEDGAPVWTIDAQVENVHFRFDWLEAEQIGYRAFIAAVSDLAAMAARPVAALVAVCAPAEHADRIDDLYDGLGRAARLTACPIVGGDLSAGSALSIVVTALGRATPGAALRRSGARPGDEVWATGSFGGPAAALAVLESRVTVSGGYRVPRRFAEPRARIEEMSWLVERATVHAAIDVSDGISTDAGHVADASEVRVTIDAERVPIDPDALEIAEAAGVEPLDWALHGGEEFEILLVAPSGAVEPVAKPFLEAFGIPLTRIGEVSSGSGVTLRSGGSERPLETRGWDHFRSIASRNRAR